MSTFGRLCKAAAELDDPATMARDVEALLAVATSGRPGPVLLSVPEDALLEAVEEVEAGGADPDAGGGAGGAAMSTGRRRTPGAGWIWAPAPDDDQVRDVLRRLARARRPVVLAGAGVLRSRAVAELAAFADAADVPVMATWRRPDVFANDSPRYLGATGLAAARTVRPRLLEADVILAIGTRLSEVATFEYAVPGPGNGASSRRRRARVFVAIGPRLRWRSAPTRGPSCGTRWQSSPCRCPEP